MGAFKVLELVAVVGPCRAGVLRGCVQSIVDGGHGEAVEAAESVAVAAAAAAESSEAEAEAAGCALGGGDEAQAPLH